MTKAKLNTYDLDVCKDFAQREFLITEEDLTVRVTVRIETSRTDRLGLLLIKVYEYLRSALDHSDDLQLHSMWNTSDDILKRAHAEAIANMGNEDLANWLVSKSDRALPVQHTRGRDKLFKTS